MKKRARIIMIINVIVINGLILAALAVLLIMGRRVDVHTDKNVEGLSAELQEVFYLAGLSPSSHNIQSWIIDVYGNENRVEIQIDPKRNLSVVDPGEREMYISLGCYTETLVQAFKAYGYNTACKYDITGNRMTVSYEKISDAVVDDLIARIISRHTDKAPFEKDKPVDSRILDEVVSGSETLSYYTIGTDEYEVIKSSTQAAYNNQAYDPAAAEELSGLLRFSDSEAKNAKDGLPAEQLGMTGIKKGLYYLTTDHESAKGETFAKQGIQTTEKQLEGCNTFVLISSDNDEEALIDCGRSTVKFWLKMVEKGISVHPMSYALEDTEIKSDMMSDLRISGVPQMILRIGYVPDYGTNAGIRRDLSEYVSLH